MSALDVAELRGVAPAARETAPARPHLVVVAADPDAEFLERFRLRRLRRLAPVTVRNQVIVVRAFANWLAPRLLAEATAEDVAAFLDRPITPRTRLNILAALRAFFDMVEEEGAVTANPARTSGAPAARLPLDDLVDAYIDERLRRRTLGPVSGRSYRNNLHVVVRGLGPVPLEELSRRHFEEWLEVADLAPSTVRLRISQFRHFAAWLIDHGHIASDPTRGVRGPREPRRLPRGLKGADARQLVAAAPDARTKLALLLMLQEGLRRKEVAGLQLGDIDFDERTMLVIGKGDHERVLPITDETWAAMTAYLSECPATAGPLIRNRRNGRAGVAPVTIGREVGAVMYAAGLKAAGGDGRSAHSLRHTMAGDMLRHGAHLRDVQAALGHRSIVATERYLPLVVQGLAGAMSGRRYDEGQG